MKKEVERRGAYEDIILFVQGHASTLKWVYQQQSEYRSRGVRVNARGVELTSEHTSPKNGPVNSKAGIYVCSELWKPQGQNIYMKSAVHFCLCTYCKCVFALMYVCVSVFGYRCNWGQQNSEVSKEKAKRFLGNLWNPSLWNSTSEEASGETRDSHQGYQKSNNTLR